MLITLRSRLLDIVNDVRRLSQRPGAPDGEAILGQVVAPLPFAALVANDHGRYVVANGAATDLTGYSGRELRDMSVWDLTPGGVERDADVLWRAFLQQREQSGDYVLVTKDGRLVTAAYVARAHVLPGLHLSLLAPDT